MTSKKTNPRQTESENAARILRVILAINPVVPGITPRDRKAALGLAISVLDARAFDAQHGEE